jgi:DNA invertase Pin-like site-specific DNA recombinase/uncharacterized coiled-coil protein SlyX
MNAVIYARYSSDNQREESIEGQFRECQEYADRYGLTVIGTYIDRAFSAKTDDRPEFQRMIKESAKRLFEVVLVWKLDRFARSRTDSAMNKFILKKNGVKVISAKENISDGPEGIILEAMLEGYAEYYSADLSEKILRGLTENALKGRYNGGGLPLGYKTDSEQHYQIDPLTAPIVQEVFTRYADGETVAQITSSLRERGLVSSRGKPFNKNSLHTMLKNRKYIGEYKYNDIVHPDTIPPIISKEVFALVQERLEKNKKAPAKKKAPVEYLLTTKLFCGKCGAFMVGESGTSKTGRIYNYYKCAHAKRGRTCDKKAIQKDFIERFVASETKRLVFQDDMIDRVADAVVEYQKKEKTTLPLLQKQLKEAEKGIENMLDAIQQGIITSSTKQRLDDLEARKADLEISIVQEKMQKPVLTKEQIVFWISRFKDGDIDDVKYQRSVIDVFVNSVYVYDDKLVLMYNYKDGAKTVALEDIQSSDFIGCTPPRFSKPLSYLFLLNLKVHPSI